MTCIFCLFFLFIIINFENFLIFIKTKLNLDSKMSLYTCAISGLQLKEPVVSVKTGYVYERELIVKHITATGQCPVTNSEMSV